MTRSFLLIALAAVTVVGFLGCSRRSTNPGRIVTLTMLTWGGEREEKSLRAHVREFEKAHPNIRVKLLITPHVRVFDKLMITTAGGRPPDISRISSLWFHSCAAKRLFEDLEPYAEADPSFDLSDFYKEAVDGWGRHKGRLYAVPTDIDVYAMYYNKDLFDRNGIGYPDWSWDWRKYLETAKKLTKDLDGDGRCDQWGTSIDQFWQSYAYQNGGSILSGDLERCTIAEPSAYEAFQWMSDLMNKHHVSPTTEETAGSGSTFLYSMKLFANGRLGMYISGSWAAELQLKGLVKDFTYDVAPLPKGKERATFIGGGGYAMLKRSRHKKEAWELLKWMTGPEYQRRAALDSQIIPSRRSVAESGAYLKQDKPPKHREVFLQMIEYGRPTPPVSIVPEMNEMITAEIALTLLGKKSAREACEAIAPKIDQLLRHQE
ncbi:MAG: sugar ABC transporter substrate-binding protein [Armatimonadetes bacterium]|nr:sugar ABC transporter substrate-binding protein [Armatimonadota bacterium]